MKPTGLRSMRRRRAKYQAAELHRSGLDTRGNPVDDGDPVHLPRVLAWLTQSEEAADGSRRPHDQGLMLIDWADMPDGVRVTERDRIWIPEGRLAGWWHVDGEPAEWPRGVQVALTRNRSDNRRY